MNKRLTTLAAFCALGMTATSQAATIDIAILYTDQAAAATTNINTKINQYIAFSNQVYSQNGVDITLRLVGSENLGNHAITPSSSWLNSVTNSSYIQGLRNSWGGQIWSLCLVPVKVPAVI